MANLELKRVLGLPTITFIAIGTTIGGGIFIFTGLVFKIAGQGLPIAFALAIIPVFISMMPIAMLGSAMPTVGGNYMYPSRMVSPGLGFVGIWSYGLCTFFGSVPLYAIGCAKYAQAVFPSLPVTFFAVCLVTFFVIINYLGIKLAAQIQGILVMILIAALLYYAFSGFIVIDPENFNNVFEKGTGSILLGTALLTFTYLGSNAIIELGGEIIDPGKTIPRAFFIAFPIIGVLYIAVAIATVGAAPLDKLHTFAEPLISVSEITCSKGGALFFIFGGAILALTTTLNATFMWGTKSLLIIVEDNILPPALGKIHRRFKTPHVLLLVVWAFSIIGVVSGFSLQTLASYASLGGLLIFLPILLASLKFRTLYPEQYEKAEFKLKGFWLWFCPVVGIVMAIFFVAILFADLKSPLKIGAFLIFIVSGVLFYQLRKRYLKAKGIDLEKLMSTEAWNE